jgi:HEAT repeat protein
LDHCTRQLLRLVERASEGCSFDELSTLVEEFAGEQRRILSEIGDLDEEERRYLAGLRSEVPSAVLPALSRLRGKANQILIDATISLLDSPEEIIRCTAAGNLGTVASTEALEPLKRIALDDPMPLVRVEAGLALNEIGTPEARAALAEYQGGDHPDDRLDQLI